RLIRSGGSTDSGGVCDGSVGSLGPFFGAFGDSGNGLAPVASFNLGEEAELRAIPFDTCDSIFIYAFGEDEDLSFEAEVNGWASAVASSEFTTASFEWSVGGNNFTSDVRNPTFASPGNLKPGEQYTLSLVLLVTPNPGYSFYFCGEDESCTNILPISSGVEPYAEAFAFQSSAIVRIDEVPVPGAALLMLSGLGFASFWGRRRRR
ncbi:MAG: PEP-CTERM sorting domain-containing protein, partial [Parvularcula sp.]|nr:PEP-CTERM sorting domain-containing protein [Parvularcula sp.]